MTEYFWTTRTDRGDTVTLSEGGFYEKIESGQPVAIHGGDGYAGFEKSDRQEIPASKSPEASLFAKVQSARSAGMYHIYSTSEVPDTDVSNGTFDFGLIEEVRYTVDGERAIVFSHFKSVTVPAKAVEDVELAYAGDAGDVWTLLGTRVKNGLAQLLSGGTYPTDIPESAFEDSQVAEYYDDYDSFMSGDQKYR